MTQDLKTKLIEEAQERFAKTFKYDELTGRTIYLGNRALVPTPYFEDFLATEIGNAVEKTTEETYSRLLDKWDEWSGARIALPDVKEVLSTLIQTKGEDKSTYSLDHVFGDVQGELDKLTIISKGGGK